MARKAESRKRTYDEIKADEKEWVEASQQKKRLKQEAGPKINLERWLRPAGAPMKPWPNQPLHRYVEKPSEKPDNQEFIVAQTKHSAKASSSTAAVNVQFIDENVKDEIFDEDDDDYFNYFLIME